jgi:hypothetical protein
MLSDPSEGGKTLVTKCASGTADEGELKISIAEAWRAVLKDPKERAEIAALLGAEESELNPEDPPFSAEVEGSGTFGAEVLIALGTGFSVGFVKEFGKGIGSQLGRKAADALRDLWIDHIRDRVSPPGTGRLGPEK